MKDKLDAIQDLIDEKSRIESEKIEMQK